MLLLRGRSCHQRSSAGFLTRVSEGVRSPFGFSFPWLHCCGTYYDELLCWQQAQHEGFVHSNRCLPLLVSIWPLCHAAGGCVYSDTFFHTIWRLPADSTFLEKVVCGFSFLTAYFWQESENVHDLIFMTSLTLLPCFQSRTETGSFYFCHTVTLYVMASVMVGLVVWRREIDWMRPVVEKGKMWSAGGEASMSASWWPLWWTEYMSKCPNISNSKWEMDLEFFTVHKPRFHWIEPVSELTGLQSRLTCGGFTAFLNITRIQSRGKQDRFFTSLLGGWGRCWTEMWERDIHSCQICWASNGRGLRWCECFRR